MQLRTLFPHGAPLSLLFSTASTLFLSPRGWYPCCLRAPASGSSVLRFFPQLLALCFQQLAASFFLFALFLPTQLFVFNRLQTLFQKHRGWGWAHNPAIWNQQHPDSFFPRFVLLGALRASVPNPLRFRTSPQPAWWRRGRGCRCEYPCPRRCGSRFPGGNRCRTARPAVRTRC